MTESSKVAAERLIEVMRMKSLLEEKKDGGDEAVAVAAVKVELAKKEKQVKLVEQLKQEVSVIPEKLKKLKTNSRGRRVNCRL